MLAATKRATPCTTGRSRAEIAPQGQASQSGQREDGFEDDAARQQLAELHAGHGEDGDQRIAERVRGDHPRFGDTFSSSRAHIILAENVQDSGPGGAHQHRRLEESEREGGKQQGAQAGDYSPRPTIEPP
jgi:hypothetical protein